jgi:hypothetical protein
VLQYQAYPIFAYNNTYKQLISASQYQSYMVCRSDNTLYLVLSARLLTGPWGFLLQPRAVPKISPTDNDHPRRALTQRNVSQHWHLARV